MFFVSLPGLGRGEVKGVPLALLAAFVHVTRHVSAAERLPFGLDANER